MRLGQQVIKGVKLSNSILIVDDDKIFRQEFKLCFDDYNIIEASNGEEAFKILSKPNDIELVFLDVIMPGQFGTDTLKKIKKNWPDLKIVMLTGCSTETIVIESLKGRADDYLVKPIDIEKTRSVIKRLILEKESDIDAIDMKSKIERVKRFIEKNAFKKIMLKDAASSIFLSPKYMSKVFKENTGVNFNTYKTKIKLDLAKGLLKDTAYNVCQIADKLGYINTETFIRQFKKFMGKAPAQFRAADIKSPASKKQKRT